MAPTILHQIAISRFFRLFVPIAVPIVFGIAAGLPHIDDLDIRRAIIGWSPISYVAAETCPECFARDWPTSIRLYGASLPMRLHLILEQSGLISAEAFLNVYVVLQLTVLAAGAWLLARSLMHGIAGPAGATALTLTSVLAGMNMSNYGYGFLNYPPDLFYNWTHGFVLAAIGLTAMDRRIAAAICISVAALSHPTAALPGIIFMAVYPVFVSRTDWLAPRSILSVVIVMGTILFVGLQTLAAPPTDAAPNEEIYRRVLVSNSHLLPVHLGFLQSWMYKFTVPSMLTIIMGSLVLWHRWQGTRAERFILIGSIVILLVTVLGLAATWFIRDMFILRMTLPRASFIVTAISVIVIAGYLTRILLSPNFLRGVLAGFSLTGMVFLAPGLPALPILAILVLDSWRKHNTRVFLGFCVIAFAGLSTAQWLYDGVVNVDVLTGATPSYRSLSIFSTLSLQWVIILGLGFGVFFQIYFAAVRWWAGNHFEHRWRWIPHSALVVALVVATVAVHEDNFRRYHNYIEPGQDAAMLQSWIRQNTDRTILFAAPPTGPIAGWREFSHRSYFGHARGWLHGAGVYASSLDNLAEGERRLAFFGYAFPDEPTEQLEESVRADRSYYMRELYDIVGQSYHDLTPERFRRLHTEFGVDLAIVETGNCPECRNAFPLCHAYGQFELYGLSGTCGGGQ